ncbi:MAG: hypothetical protein ACOC84_07225, partial [Actinomycetota bacterium]
MLEMPGEDGAELLPPRSRALMESDLLALVPLLFGVVIVAVASLAVTGMAADGGLVRNGAAGIRTRHTRASDAAWQAGHVAALPLVTDAAGAFRVPVDRPRPGRSRQPRRYGR